MMHRRRSDLRGLGVEVRGFEPLASSVRGRRSAGLSYTPRWRWDGSRRRSGVELAVRRRVLEGFQQAGEGGAGGGGDVGTDGGEGGDLAGGEVDRGDGGGMSRRKPPPGPRRAAMGTPASRRRAMSRSTVRTSTRRAAARSSAVACRPAARRSSSIRRCWRSTRSLARWGWVGATGRAATMSATPFWRDRPGRAGLPS